MENNHSLESRNILSVGDSVAIKSHDQFVFFGKIVGMGGNELNSKKCYFVETYKGILKFYLKPELGSRRHLNVVNNAFWIES